MEKIFNSLISYFNEVREVSLLTEEEEEQELFLKYKNGDEEARNKIIKSNLPLVISIAKKYANSDIPFLDLIQEGNIALMKAVEKFDINLEYRFSTFAFITIQRRILNAVYTENYNNNYSVYYSQKFLMCKNAYINFEGKFGRGPSMSELAKELQMSEKKLQNLLSLYFEQISLNIKTSNKNINEDTESELIEFIESDEISPEDNYVSQNMKMDERKLINNPILTPKENFVLKYRYGLNGKRPLTLEEIAPCLNITRERVRQIEQRALEKLRTLNEVKYLAEYFENPETLLNNLENLRYEDAKKHILTKKTVELIYKYFLTYADVDIDFMLKKLSKKDKVLLNKYEFDLINHEQEYSELIIKMEDILSSPKLERKR